VIEGNDSWYKFESAQIAFQLPQLVSLAQIHASWFPEPFRELSIALTSTAKNFTVTSIRCGDRELTLAARTCTRKELVTSQNQLTDLENRLGAAEQAMSKPSQPKGPDPAFARLRQESTREIERLNKEITQKRAEITKQSSVQIKLSGSEEEGSSTRDQIDALMADLNLPESYYRREFFVAAPSMTPHVPPLNCALSMSPIAAMRSQYLMPSGYIQREHYSLQML
jgi:hypothetical protein